MCPNARVHEFRRARGINETGECVFCLLINSRGAWVGVWRGEWGKVYLGRGGHFDVVCQNV